MREPVEVLIRKYEKKLYVTAFNICQNTEDAKDAVQDTFIDYHTSKKEFADEQNIRFWLFRVVINKSKDITKSFWRKKNFPLDDYVESLPFVEKEDSSLLEAVLALPQKYRIVIHLFYYEDLSISEIAKVIKIKESNVKVRLNRGRNLLKQRLKEDWDYDE